MWQSLWLSESCCYSGSQPAQAPLRSLKFAYLLVAILGVRCNETIPAFLTRAISQIVVVVHVVYNSIPVNVHSLGTQHHDVLLKLCLAVKTLPHPGTSQKLNLTSESGILRLIWIASKLACASATGAWGLFDESGVVTGSTVMEASFIILASERDTRVDRGLKVDCK